MPKHAAREKYNTFENIKFPVTCSVTEMGVGIKAGQIPGQYQHQQWN